MGIRLDSQHSVRCDRHPEKYIPALADGAPSAWLFLRNQNVDALTLWNEGGDEKTLLAKAARHWETVRK